MFGRSTRDFTVKDVGHPRLSALSHCFRESRGFSYGAAVVVVGTVISIGIANTPCLGTSGVSAGFWMSSSSGGGGTLRLN